MLKYDSKKPNVIRHPMPVNPDDFAPGRGYLYYLYTDMVEWINKLEDVCVYMEYCQPWSDKKGARQAGAYKPRRK